MRFIITSFGSLGDLNPYLGLGRALTSRGHDVILALPQQYVPHAEAAGLRGHAVRPDIDPTNREVVRRVMDPFRGAEYLIREWMMPNVDASWADVDALVRDGDILVSHPLTYAVAQPSGLTMCEQVGRWKLKHDARRGAPMLVADSFQLSTPTIC